NRPLGGAVETVFTSRTQRFLAAMILPPLTQTVLMLTNSRRPAADSSRPSPGGIPREVRAKGVPAAGLAPALDSFRRLRITQEASPNRRLPHLIGDGCLAAASACWDTGRTRRASPPAQVGERPPRPG